MLRVPKPGKVPSPKGNPERLASLYVEWHWGTKPTKVMEIDDPRLPTHLVECGRLVQLEIEVPDASSPRGFKFQALTIPDSEQEHNHIAFDPDHKSHRLYIVLGDKTRADARRLYADAPYGPASLVFWAKLAGGRHGTSDYPNIMVKPLGILRTGGYATNKLPDGPSWYKHMLGEESGIRPVLTVSQDGSLWIAGGDYTSPTPGITN